MTKNKVSPRKTELLFEYDPKNGHSGIGGYTVSVPTMPISDRHVGLLDSDTINYLVGKIKTWADSAFADSVQREAAKDILNDLIWNTLSDMSQVDPYGLVLAIERYKDENVK